MGFYGIAGIRLRAENGGLWMEEYGGIYTCGLGLDVIRARQLLKAIEHKRH
jgi:hypothetical protein